MRLFLLIKLLLLAVVASAATPPILHRICVCADNKICLRWFPPSADTTCSGSFSYLRVFAKRPNADTPLAVLTSFDPEVTNFQLNDAALYRSATFFIQYVCGDSSFIESNRRQPDVTPPPPLSLDSISFNQSGQPIVGWSPSLAEDITGYVLYKTEGGLFESLDTFGLNQPRFFTDTNAVGASGSLGYAVAPIDSCGNVTPIGSSQRSTFIGASQDPCTGNITIQWQRYRNHPSPIDEHILYIQAGDSDIVVTLKPGDSIYVIPGGEVRSDIFYSFRVRTIFASGISALSNTSLYSTLPPDLLPGFIINKTVCTDAGIEVYYTLRGLEADDRAAIVVGPNPQALFDTVDVPATSGTQVLEAFADSFSTLHMRGIIRRPCGIPLIQANLAVQPLLYVQRLEGIDEGTQLTWQPYRGHFQQEDVAVVEITYTDTVRTYTRRITVDSSAYIDDEEYNDVLEPGICYRIGFPGINNSSLDTSYTCKQCVADPPQVFVPNAFVPEEGGLNLIWRPVFSSVRKSSISCYIYSRWGQLLYEVEGDFPAWDGTTNGKLVPVGAYAYIIKFKGIRAAEQTRSGFLYRL